MEGYKIPFEVYKDTLTNIHLKRKFVISEVKETVTELITDLSHSDDYMSELEGVCVRFNGEQAVEADEFYIVSDLLFEQLKNRGEMVVKFKGLNIWGKVGTGELEYSSIISEICNDLLILDRSKK